MQGPNISKKRKREEYELLSLHWGTNKVYVIDSDNKSREIEKIKTLRYIRSHMHLFTGSFAGELYSVEYFEVDIHGHTAYYITFHYHRGSGHNQINRRLNRNLLSHVMMQWSKCIFKNTYKTLGDQQMVFNLIGKASTKNRFLNKLYTATEYNISPEDLIDNQILKESIDKMLRNVNAVRIIQMLYLHYRSKKIKKIKDTIVTEIALVKRSYKQKSFTRLLNSTKSLKGLYDLLEKITLQQADEKKEKELDQECLETLEMSLNDRQNTTE
uniref:Uncharacterized protein n=1 Tax=viral metagenome TaxID=1070528 RepID=A0A6C0I2F9_9ZZZZ